MLKCKLDVDASREVYDRFKDNIKPKMCYNNVHHVFEWSSNAFREGKWKIAYGYAEVMAGLYFRHSFILDESNKVIDPTVFAQPEPQLQTEHREYYVMAVFDDVDEYLTAIENNDYLPILDKHFLAYDIKARQWAQQNGIVFVK